MISQIKKNIIGNVLIVCLFAAPVLLWLFIAPLRSRFANPFQSLTSIGQVSGLAGMALFCVSLVLSSRIKPLDRFLGMDNIYKKHHLLGVLSFVLLLLHPIVLILRFAFLSVSSIWRFLVFSFTNPPVLLGTVSIILMIVLMLLTLYFRPRYSIWKISHKFLGLAFFLASLHVFFTPSDVSRTPTLKMYMLFLVFLGLASVVYRVIFNGSRKWLYVVGKVEKLNENIFEVVLMPKTSSMKYKSGQFAFISFQSREVGKEYHPFSFVSTGQDRKVTVAIKKLGDYTKNIEKLKEGTPVKVEGPYGKFNFENFSKGQVWIAGGIGIAPFLGMAKDAVQSAEYKICLFYCARDAKDAVYIKEFEELSKSGNFEFVPFFSSNNGLISAEAVGKLCGGIQDKAILMCGPPAMMKSLKKQFVAGGVSKNNIYFEDFSL